MYIEQKYYINSETTQAHLHAINDYTSQLNAKEWDFSNHAKQRIKERTDLQYFSKFLISLILKSQDIFEYRTIDNNITRTCYRIPYNKREDIILSVAMDKTIITIYFNNNTDKHKTLNKSQYANL